MKINVAAHCPNPTDVTSLYRGLGPLLEIRKISNEKEINIIPFERMNWVMCKSADLVFLQRPYLKEHVEMVKMAKMNRKPVWVDYDDFLLDIPLDNPAYGTYMRPDVHSNIANILSMADFVTVTTRALKALYEQPVTAENGVNLPMGQNVHVIPNSYDYFYHGLPVKNSGNKLVTWRGTNTHDRDIQDYEEPLVEFFKANPEWKIEFIGFRPWRTIEKIGSQARFKSPVDPMYYMDYLKKIGPSVHIVPLNDSIFNRCKSNIAWIEATVAGASVIAPDWEQWRNPGTITYTSKGDFYAALDWFSKNQEILENKRKESLDWMLKNYNLVDSNKKRLTIIEQALDIKKEYPKAPRIPQSDYANLFRQEEFGMELE